MNIFTQRNYQLEAVQQKRKYKHHLNSTYGRDQDIGTLAER